MENSKEPSYKPPLLVVAVDRDDDLGRAGFKTPVVGRDAVLQLAVQYALKRPEDSDLNVLFESVKVLDELRAQGFKAEVAVVSGDASGGIQADIRIRTQVQEVLKRCRAKAIVLVSDGAEDELVVPVLQSLAPIYSIKRVVVEQHRGVEETYMLLARYLKKAIEEPRFARLVLGVPGIVITVFSVLAILGWVHYAVLVGLCILGVAMIVRGFNLEPLIASLVKRTPSLLVAYIVAGLALASAVALAYYEFIASSALPLTTRVAKIVRGVTDLAAFSVIVIIIAHAVTKLASGDVKISREVASLLTTGLVVFLMSVLASSIESLKELDIAALVTAMIESNFVLYAIASVAIVTLVWRLTAYLDRMLEEHAR